MERTSTFEAGEASSSFGIASIPLPPGIVTSIRITSGLWSIVRNIASRAVDASSTGTTPSCCPRSRRRPERTTAWSSTIRTRMSLSAAPHDHPLERLPEPSGDERLLPAAGERRAHLEVRRSDHHVEVEAGAVHASALALLARVAEAGAERDVRRGVLVEQRVVVDQLLASDPRRRVHERDLAETAVVRLRVEEGGEEVAVGVALRLEAHEPPAAELPRDPLDQAPVHRERVGAAEDAIRCAGVRAREHLLGRDVRRDDVAVGVALAAAAPDRARREPQLEGGAGAAQPGALDLHLPEPLGALPDRLGVLVPAGGPRRVLGAEPAEVEQVAREPPLRLVLVEFG